MVVLGRFTSVGQLHVHSGQRQHARPQSDSQRHRHNARCVHRLTCSNYISSPRTTIACSQRVRSCFCQAVISRCDGWMDNNLQQILYEQTCACYKIYAVISRTYIIAIYTIIAIIAIIITTYNIQCESKKVAPLKLFAIFSLRLGLFP